ncbi:MAG: hypothetical protein R3D02_13125 [Hyphomicrobiales bacterium]
MLGTETAKEEGGIEEQKQAALGYIRDAWEDALAHGIDPDILVNAALFQAFTDLVSCYGESPVADFAAKLPNKIQRGDFTIQRKIQ